MDDKTGHQQCLAFANSARRISEMIQATQPTSESLAIVVEVVKIIKGFQVLGMTYADQLVKSVQEVRVLQKEKQILEKKVEMLHFQLSPIVSSMVSRKVTDAPMVDLNATFRPEEQVNGCSFKEGCLEINLHRRCEEEAEKQERESAKLRQAYTACMIDVRECRKRVLELETRLKNLENEAARKEKERLELLKALTEEISSLKNETSRLKDETVQIRKEAGSLEEQLGRATLKNEQFVDLLKADSKRQDELRRQQKTLKGYLQHLASKFVSVQESEDLQIELKGLECRGLDEDTTSYLRTILERGLKIWQEHVREKCLSHAGSKRPIEIIDLDNDTDDERGQPPATRHQGKSL